MDTDKNVRRLEDKILRLEEQIANLKHAESALKKERDFTNEVLYWIDSLVVVIDLEGCIVSFNKASEQLSGYRFEDFKKTPFWDILILPEEREGVKGTIVDVVKNGLPKTFQNNWVTKSGETCLISWMNSILRKQDGTIEYILCTGMDITERTQAEKALRKSETQYRELVQSANSIIIRLDKRGNFIFINDFAEKFFGFGKDELIGQNVAGTILPETDVTGLNLASLIGDIAANPEQYANYENENVRKNGERVWVAWTNKVITDEASDIVELLCIGNDNTERKRLEQQLQQAQKMEAVGTLAGGVAHDLNNILSGIISYPELLLLDIPTHSPLRDPILKIKESGQKAAAIVQDLLTLARRGVAINEVVNLNQIISDLRNTPEFENLKALHRQIEFEFRLEHQLLNVKGSSVHLSKTIMNLLSNAAESVSDSGRVKIVTGNRYLDRPIRGYEDVLEGDYVLLSILDTGIGIAAEDLSRIFEPFFTKKVMGRSGTGLGMAVVWGTVKDHNGYIDVQSIRGHGTRCDLYFPVTRHETTDLKENVSFDQCRGEETILVVDDIKTQREIAHQLLSRLGYTVNTVSSGEEAVAYLKKDAADLVILDMIMDPGIDGLETYLRILENNPSQKAIVTSGFSETDRVKKTLGLGAGAYVKKPYVLEKLGLAVRSELDA